MCETLEENSVKKVLSSGAMILSQMDGSDLKDPINSDAVKMYYP